MGIANAVAEQNSGQVAQNNCKNGIINQPFKSLLRKWIDGILESTQDYTKEY